MFDFSTKVRFFSSFAYLEVEHYGMVVSRSVQRYIHTYNMEIRNLPVAHKGLLAAALQSIYVVCTYRTQENSLYVSMAF